MKSVLPFLLVVVLFGFGCKPAPEVQARIDYAKATGLEYPFNAVYYTTDGDQADILVVNIPNMPPSAAYDVVLMTTPGSIRRKAKELGFVQIELRGGVYRKIDLK